MKTCVIIGSGLGGLSCGCILALNGFRVIILEQSNQIGGCLQCFQRDGVTFETGMHYIGSAAPGQTLHTIFRYLGIDKRIQLSQLDTNGYDIISLQGRHYPFANGQQAFIDTLSEHFPDSRVELQQYLQKIKRVGDSSAIHSLNRNARQDINAEWQITSVDTVIDQTISNPTLREVLTGILPLYAGIKRKTPFAIHALIADFYNKSAYRIVGGSSRIATALAEQIKQKGGEIHIRQKVVKIECDERRATAVITQQGQRFETDIVISSIHPTATIQLIDSHLIRPIYRHRLKHLVNTIGAFTVYLKFHKNKVPYMNSNLFCYRSSTTWNSEQYDEKSWPKSLLYMHFCHEPHPRYAESGQIISYMKFSDVEKWVGTNVGRRGNEYETFKKQKAEQLICALEKEIPGIRANIESYYTSTPLTYYDYTGTPCGSMYGVAKDVNVFAQGGVSCKTRIPNLLLTGQSTVLHGMLGTLAGSFVTCSEVISTDEIFAQLQAAR